MGDSTGGAQHGDIEGYIIPPPDLRNIIAKTAQFVAKNGSSFEARIRQTEKGNLKFNFLKPEDPYHAYYLSKIEDAAVGKVKKEDEGPKEAQQQQPEVKEEQKPEGRDSAAGEAAAKAITKEAEHSRVGLIAKMSKDIGSEPPAKDVFTVTVPRLTPAEVDTVKLAAKFTALSGRNFLSAIAQREINNPEFDFLKPTHVLFPFFTSLVDAYDKCVKPSKELKTKLSDTLNDRNRVLQRCVRKLHWKRKEEEQKRERESMDSADQVAFHSIDWHDFVVVETLTFDDDDNLPAPAPKLPAISPSDEKRKASQLQLADTNLAKRGRIAAAANEEDDERIVVRPDHKIQAGPRKDSGPRFFIDPRTGRQIPITESEEHMRIELLDPKWKEQQQRALDSQATSQFATDEQIAANLANLGQHRPDIFGGDELQQQKKKEAESKGRVIWDGHTASVQDVQRKALEQQQKAAQRQSSELPKKDEPVIGPSVPRTTSQAATAPTSQAAAQSSAPSMPTGGQPQSQFMSQNAFPAQQQNVPPLPPQGGFAPPGMPMGMMPPPGMPPRGMPNMPPGMPPPPMMGAPGMMGMMPPGMPGHPAPPAGPGGVPAGPPPPQQRTSAPEELVSESEFLKTHSGQFTIHIAVPREVGNSISLQIDYTTRVGALKTQLVPLLASSGLKANKMQLKHPIHGFMKDSLSVAHYNVNSSVQVLLIPKVRGRR